MFEAAPLGDQVCDTPTAMHRWTSRLVRRRLVALTILAFAVAAPRSAAAWYFPEHAEITRIGFLRHVPLPLQREIMAAVVDARNEGLRFCAGVVPMQNLRAETGCVPYNVLPALAGDHGNDTAELRATLTLPQHRWPFPSATVGDLSQLAAAAEWRAFLRNSPPEWGRIFSGNPTRFSPRTDLETGGVPRSQYPRGLDLQLQMVDHDYAQRAGDSRAHFQDPLSSVANLITAAVAGDLDNALAQLVAHHVRALLLAVRARNAPRALAKTLRTEALLEHAFALHFIEDAFAAGHIATEHGISKPYDRAARHDFLNRNGVGATRSFSAVLCNTSIDATPTNPGDPARCWRAYGDGYLNGENLDIVAHATARLQLQFALALDASGFTTLTAACQTKSENGSGSINCNDLERLLETDPSWTPREQLGNCTVVDSVASQLALLQAALVDLGSLPTPVAASSGTNSAQQPGRIPDAIDTKGLTARAAPSCPTPQATTLTASESQTGPAPLVNAPRSVDFSPILRPILANWPTAQADVTTLEGKRDPLRTGLAAQANVHGMFTGLPTSSPGTGSAALFASAGISARVSGVLARRVNRPILELSVGAGPNLTWNRGLSRFGWMSMAEVRAPLPLLVSLLGAYTFRSATLARWANAPFGIGPYGARAYVRLPSPSRDYEDTKLAFVGWDVEVGYISVSRLLAPLGESTSLPTEIELRFRVGSMTYGAYSAGIQEPRSLSFSAELTGGWAWFL
jgi:hypothetical protein